VRDSSYFSFSFLVAGQMTWFSSQALASIKMEDTCLHSSFLQMKLINENLVALSEG
jgi:hypothetical protein